MMHYGFKESGIPVVEGLLRHRGKVSAHPNPNPNLNLKPNLNPYSNPDPEPSL